MNLHFDFNRVWWFLKNMTPYHAYHALYSAHKFDDYEESVKGYKWAIYYGCLYFERSKYKNGTIDLNERSQRVDKILNMFKNPTDRIEYIHKLDALDSGVEKANQLGLFSVGDNEALNKIEAARYQMAKDSLKILRAASIIYPRMWRKIFTSNVC